MTQIELKEDKYLYGKLRNKPFCAKCGKLINKSDNIHYIKIKHFRGRVEYRFYHENCIDFTMKIVLKEN